MTNYVTGDDIPTWLRQLGVTLHAAGFLHEARNLDRIVEELERHDVYVENLEEENASLHHELREMREDDYTNVVPLQPKQQAAAP